MMRGKSVMCAPERIGDADRVGVLLDGRLDDLLGRLVQPRVDDLHAGVAKRAGDDLRTAVVPIETGLRDHYPDLLRHPRGSIWR